MHKAFGLRRLFFFFSINHHNCTSLAFEAGTSNCPSAKRPAASYLKVIPIVNTKRLQGVRREAESADPRGDSKKLAAYQAWLATPFACTARQTYIPLPWYFFHLPQQALRNVSRFRLRAHTLKVESA
eukprot:491650-Pelagomonas_calceolata.AAC.1